ncbi:translation initiation factor IF-3, partial [Acinetobacter baumannii]|nr:translation initiation factor IF-3 [Acinetobacter baumannii]
TSAKQDGRNMTMVLAPHKGAKTRVKAQQAATRPQQGAAPAGGTPAAGQGEQAGPQ